MTYKEAIKELRDGLDTHTEYYLGNQADRKLAEICIKALERCQKAEESFEWCHECKEYDKEKHCCHRFTKQIRKTVSDITDHYRRLCKKQEKLRECIGTYKKCDKYDFLVDAWQLVEILKEFEVEE